MSDQRRVMQIFEQALTLDTAARVGFLEQQCGSDAALRREVEALITADGSAHAFLARPLSASGDRSGERLGPYRLAQLIGIGGMGSVYRAERADGAYTKQIAIKLLLYDAGDLRTRFALEQRILGALSHPNIASLLDVGNDANGAPYLVMEYVEGRPITVYAHEQCLDLRARLTLFLKILDAVQTAHSHLVVHRDIKPSNVLVDAHGEPKLLDFGIAKLLGDNAPSATRTGLGPLTPEYASPEQVRGEPIGTGSDIYSLGVLLFELVTGERPYQIGDTRPSAIEHTVCDTDPPRPSTRIRHHGSGNLRDLDAVVLKALEKSARQRYASCAAFADDLRRWLDGTQVQAREPPRSERMLRFLRRNRLVASAATAASLALLIGSAVALWQAHIARSARDRAEHVNHFLIDMLSAANPAELGRKATVTEVLDRAQRLAERELATDPETAASTELTLAGTYHALGDLDAARHSGEAALAAANQVADTGTAIDAQIELGQILTDRGDFAAAKAMLDGVRADALVRGSVAQQASAATALGSFESRTGNPERARHWLGVALNETPANADALRAGILNDLAIVKSSQEDNVGALETLRQSVALLRKAYPHGHPDLAKGLANVANALEAVDQLDAATSAYAEALPMQIDLLGESHPDVTQTLSSMTFLDMRKNDTAAALADGARAYAAAQKLPSDHLIAAYAATMYGEALMLAGRAHEAVPLIQGALATRIAKYPADHPLIANTQSVLGLAQAQSGDIPAGEALARAAYERLRAKLGDSQEFTGWAKGRVEQIEKLKQAASASQ